MHADARVDDTSYEAHEVQYALWRAMSLAEKGRVISGLCSAVAQLHRAGVRRRFPHATERQLFWLTASERLGEELATKAYGRLDEQR